MITVPFHAAVVIIKTGNVRINYIGNAKNSGIGNAYNEGA